MVEATTRRIRHNSFAPQQLKDALLDCQEPVERDETLGRCWLVRDSHEQVSRCLKAAKGSRRPRDQGDVSGIEGRLG